MLRCQFVKCARVQLAQAYTGTLYAAPLGHSGEPNGGAIWVSHGGDKRLLGRLWAVRSRPTSTVGTHR